MGIPKAKGMVVKLAALYRPPSPRSKFLLSTFCISSDGDFGSMSFGVSEFSTVLSLSSAVAVHENL